MASRALSDLSPAMQGYAVPFLQHCSVDPWLVANGITVLIICTFRSNAEQDELYAQGRTKPGVIVTRARAGQSAHNVMNALGRPSAEAFDFVPLRHGKPVWGTAGAGINQDPSDDEKNDLEVWQRCGEIATALGLNWYGRPNAPFREMPHCQNANWSNHHG